MRVFRIVLSSAMIVGSLSAGAACVEAQQQWGPPQQSLYNHNPGSAPTYVTQNTYVPSVAPRTTTSSASTSSRAALRSTPQHARANATAHKTSFSKSGR